MQHFELSYLQFYRIRGLMLRMANEFAPKQGQEPDPGQIGGNIVIADPELEPQNGVIASDIITLGIAARMANEVFGTALVIPEIAHQSDPALGELATVTIKGLTVSAEIDTGKLSWADDAEAAKSKFLSYAITDENDRWRQGVQVNGPGYLVQGREFAVSSVPMSGEFGKYNLWVADVPAGTTFKRYEMVKAAQELTQTYDIGLKNGQAQPCKQRTFPAVDSTWESDLPEIVEANPILEKAKQKIRFALDYTGARAAAQTIMTLRGGGGPINYTFGRDGPVMYWFTSEKGSVPFAVTLTEPDSWLKEDQAPDFNFEPDN